MKYEIIEQHSIKDNIVTTFYLLRRKYWLFNSYYSNKRSDDHFTEIANLYLVLFIFFIPISLLLSAISKLWFFGLPLLFIICKFSESSNAYRFNSIKEAEEVRDSKIKKYMLKSKIVNSLTIKNNNIILESNEIRDN